ncbi:MAG: ABC transporter ATP-binding protein [Candidatus Rokuibacteriota bacterium]
MNMRSSKDASKPPAPLYELRGVSQRYTVGGQVVHALDQVDLEVSRGEFLAVAGPSGSGKTTLLNLLGLVDTPVTGSMRFEGGAVAELDEGARTRIRRERIGYIFQTFNLIPVLTAYENVEYFLLKRGVGADEVRRRVSEALGAVGVAEQARRRPSEMSAGQRQRVAIARALVRDADVILADEPTAALDHATGRGLIDLMKKLNREKGTAFVFSTHDPRVLAAAERVVWLEDGRVRP